jgi:hypothetical protein
MAVGESSEVLIVAAPDEIMAVIADVGSLTEWSDAHQSSEVLECDEPAARFAPG